MKTTFLISSAVIGLLLAPAFAQTGDVQTAPNRSGDDAAPQYNYRVSVVGLSAPAIDYRNRKASTEIGFKGTELDPQANGRAKVNTGSRGLSVSAEFQDLKPASSFGPEYLTYVLWTITPEGRPVNLGEVIPKDSHAHLNATTELQAFGLVLTAEPYFAVTVPSNTVVVQNYMLKKTAGIPEPINVHYEALSRGAYMYSAATNPLTMQPIPIDPRQPLELYEARNSVRIAQLAGAEKYADDSFARAQQLLQQTETDATRKDVHQKLLIQTARDTVQQAEDARLLSVRKETEEQQARERDVLQAKAEAARAQADTETQQRIAAENARLQAEQASQQAQLERQQAEQERQQADQARQQADAARQAALEQQQTLAAQAQQSQQAAEQARQQAAQAEQQRQQAIQQQQEERTRLEQQLNQVLQTRNTARGLIVSMSDVLFDTGSANLRSGARERLAKVSGILLAYPDLKIQVEGHTDSTGTAEFNQRLSERRAETVRDFLISQGAKADSVTAQGFGQEMPVAANATAEGRQQNRRVEMVVSGESIGQPTVAANAANGNSATDNTQTQDTTTTTTTTTTAPVGTVSEPQPESTPAATGSGNGSQPELPQPVPQR